MWVDAQPLLADSPQSKLDSVCPDGTCPRSSESDLNALDTYKTLNWVGYVAGGAFAALGAVLLCTAPDEASGDSSATQFGAYLTTAGGGIRGTF